MQEDDVRPLSDEEMEDELQDFWDYGEEQWASGEELACIRGYIEALCPKDVEVALDLKGYACYNGGRLYEQDWQAARDCFERLVKISDNPYYANTLGYIYYYGRTGTPNYEKALQLFQFAAMHGNAESLYKLGDMYRNGYGVEKRQGVAFAIYQRVYEATRATFIEQPDGNFADAAIRMGDAYRDGIGITHDRVKAYAYYLEADCAARRRAEQTSFWGAHNVAATAASNLQEAKTHLPQTYLVKQIAERGPRFFLELLDGHFMGEIFIRKEKGGTYDMFLGRRWNGAGRIPFLVTEPRLSFCCVTEELHISGLGGKIKLKGKKKHRVVFDDAAWDAKRHRLVLYLAEKKVGVLACREYVLYAPGRQPKHGKRLRFARITFQRGGKRYDYLCDDKNVKAGDTVIVPGMNGDVPVYVESIVHMRTSELPLPFYRYKSVVRKAEVQACSKIMEAYAHGDN